MIDLQLLDRTVESHLSYVKRFLDFLDKPVNSLTVEDIRGFLATFKGKSLSTYANALKALKVFFRDFIGRFELVQSFKFPHKTVTPKYVPTKDELRKFYEALSNIKHKALFLLLATSGLRLSEALSLKVSDIDFERRIMKPNHSSRTKKAWLSFFNEEAKNALLEYVNSSSLKLEDCLFKNGRNRKLRAFETARKKTGINITPQVLREWFCCEMGRLGVPDRYVDAFCGRVPRSVLARHYTDFSPERLREIYDKANLKVLG